MRTVVPKNAHPVPPQAKRVFKGIIYDVYHWQQKMYDGRMATFEMLKRPDTVQVIAIKNDKIVALMEEQPSYQAVLGLPGGRHDVEAETELDCAKRELHEETGMRFNTWKLLTAEQQHPKIDRVIYTFLATDFAGQDAPHVDGGEKIELRELTFSKAKSIAESDGLKYWPNQIFRKVSSLQELVALPDLLKSS